MINKFLFKVNCNHRDYSREVLAVFNLVFSQELTYPYFIADLQCLDSSQALRQKSTLTFIVHSPETIMTCLGYFICLLSIVSNQRTPNGHLGRRPIIIWQHGNFYTEISISCVRVGYLLVPPPSRMVLIHLEN